MASAPQIETRDGTFTQNLVLTTNQSTISLNGTVDANTIDIQVSVNGAPFVSDPTLISFEGINWELPNPTSFPEGLALQLGLNTIQLRAIDLVGGVSNASTAQVTRVVDVDAADSLIPTGIRIRRQRDSVILLATPAEDTTTSNLDIDTLEFRGLYIYASTEAGGTSGRFRVNNTPLTEVSEQEEDITEITSNEVNFDPEAEFVRVVVTQENTFGETVGTVSETVTDILAYNENLQFTEVLNNRQIRSFIGFTHSRSGDINSNTINSDQFVDLDDSEPLYYTVTSLYYDSAQNIEFETPHSQEVLGTPLVIDTSIRDLPGRVQAQIANDYIAAIQRVNVEISLIPGSTTRDVSIDPFASEAERIWFLIDFVHRSQSFLTLLALDDVNGDGVSDAVAGSSYKQALKAALGFTTDTAVQNIIDTQFDKLAGNVQKPRLPGRPAQGQVVYYTEARPTKDLPIASGSIVSADADPVNNLAAARFVVGGTFIMSADNADAYFNFSTQRYEITADIVAESIGESGNRSAGQIKNAVSGGSGLQVVNTEATTFGLSRETNAQLAARAQLAFTGVDAGTEGGYALTSAGTIGILKTKIVKSGDDLMMRDYDEVRKKHIGGKVDIWIQGLRERTVTETFAFSFEIARDIRCQLIDLATLTFRVLDDRVTVDTPVVEILDNPSQGFGVRNVTSGEDYDLTGVVLIDFETFRLNTGIAQPVTNIDDIVTADYRYRSLNQFTFTLQPVRRVVSVVGQSSGALDIDAGFDLYKTDDPLLDGESTIAKDYMLINQVGGIPTGDTISVVDEEHILVGFFEEPLKNVGINVLTLAVFNADRSVQYQGPLDAVPDYEVIAGTATTPVKILRTASSQIASGEPVVVDYDHDENFTVTYVINDLLQQLQRVVDSKRHVTADVLVKQAINNPIDLDTTVQLNSGASKDTTDPAIRTNVSTNLNSKLIGEGIAQSDMINSIDSTTGVNFQVLPLARMGYSDGSRKMRETVLSTNTRLDSLDIGGNLVFILDNALKFPTTDDGGLTTEHKGVFQDDESMVLSSSLATVGELPNQAFIIGSDGAIITGYTDDATLIADGFTDPDDIAEERLRRSANHVVVALAGSGSPVDNPDQHAYAASYVVRGDVGPHDITAAAIEFIDLGELTLTIREVSTT